MTRVLKAIIRVLVLLIACAPLSSQAQLHDGWSVQAGYGTLRFDLPSVEGVVIKGDDSFSLYTMGVGYAMNEGRTRLGLEFYYSPLADYKEHVQSYRTELGGHGEEWETDHSWALAASIQQCLWRFCPGVSGGAYFHTIHSSFSTSVPGAYIPDWNDETVALMWTASLDVWIHRWILLGVERFRVENLDLLGDVPAFVPALDMQSYLVRITLAF